LKGREKTLAFSGWADSGGARKCLGAFGRRVELSAGMRFCSTTTRPPLADQVAFHPILLPAFEPGYGRSCTDTSRPTNAPPHADNSWTPRSISCAANPPRTGTASATPSPGRHRIFAHLADRIVAQSKDPAPPHAGCFPQRTQNVEPQHKSPQQISPAAPT
jgi:hypothetical protein